MELEAGLDADRVGRLSYEGAFPRHRVTLLLNWIAVLNLLMPGD